MQRVHCIKDSTINQRSHGTAKAACFLHEDGVLGTLNIVGSFKAYVIYDIEDGLGALKCMRNCDLFKQRKHISAHKNVAPLLTRPSHYFSPKNLLGLSRLVTAVMLTIAIPESNYVKNTVTELLEWSSTKNSCEGDVVSTGTRRT
jgi:uncharacterized C2H2 Zn-finger protein